MSEINSSKEFDRQAYLLTPNVSTGFPSRFVEMGFNNADLRKRILDVGCGCGGDALQWGDQIFGIDPNLGQYVQNGTVIGKLNPSVPDRGVRALAEELPFKDGTFDIVYSVKAVGWYPRNINFEMALREMLRVTKKRTGIVCFNFGQEMTREMMNNTLNKLHKEGYGVNVSAGWIYLSYPEFDVEEEST